MKVRPTAEGVRAFLEALNSTLEKDGFLLLSVHFDRNEETGQLRNVRMSYEEKTKTE